MRKKQFLGMFTAGLMLLTTVGVLQPWTPVRAEESAQVRSINLNRNGRIAGIADPTSAGSSSAYWSGDYVHMGEYKGNMIRWRVLDANTAGIFHEKETMLLWADAILEEMPFRRDYWAADASEWSASDIRTWLGETLFPGFEEGEQAAIAVSTKEALAEDEIQPENRVFAPLKNDRLFLLDDAEVKSAYGFGTSRARGIGDAWWTRSAISNMHNHQGAFCRIGNAVVRGCYEGNIGVVPACNLDLSKVAFVSRGLVRKSSVFTLTEDGGEIGMWNLTLMDGDGFAAQRSSEGQVGSGDKVTVEVTALASGSSLPYTQISAMLADRKGTVLAYGKISGELQTGEVGITIPEGIPDGKHTLLVFEERVTEGTDLIQTDYASNMAEIPLTIGESGSGGTGTTEPETEAPEPETKEPETEAPEPETQEPETQEPETEAPEPETQEPETEAPEPETKEPETEAPKPEAPETKTPESENKISETGIQAPETPRQQEHPGTKRPSRPKIARIVRRGRTFCVRWKKLSEKMSGFQIQYSTSKKFRGIGVRNVYVKKGKAVQKKITGLKPGKKYYVRVRAFRKENGRRHYSMWSKMMRIK